MMCGACLYVKNAEKGEKIGTAATVINGHAVCVDHIDVAATAGSFVHMISMLRG